MMMLVMTFPKSKKSRYDNFFDKKFFELMYQFLHSKCFWKRRAARRELCRVYVAKFRETFGKMEHAKMLAVNNLMQEFKEIEKEGRVLVIKFFSLMEEEIKRNG
ncbi:hypothetical protein KJ761_00330 [Patescibacteria group bacterium]|nr:hypothetical protein [Patescibacteria group bacterium]